MRGLFQGKDLLVEKRHYRAVARKGDHHQIAGVQVIGDVGVELHGLVENDLPLIETASDPVYDGVDAAVIHINQLPKIMPLRGVIEEFIQLEIVKAVKALYLYLRRDRHKLKAHGTASLCIMC